MGPEVIVALKVAGTVLSAVSAIKQGNEAQSQGIAQQMMADSIASQKRQQAGQEIASSQRKAIIERQNKDKVLGDLQAATGKGGGGFDASTAQITSGIEGEGEYRALSALFEGKDRAVNLEYGATMDNFEGTQFARAGKTARKAGLMKAATTVGIFGPSLFDKYGGGGFGSLDDSMDMWEANTGYYGFG